MRKFILLFMLLLTACGGQAQPTPTPTRTPIPTWTATPVSASTVAPTVGAVDTPMPTVDALEQTIVQGAVAAAFDGALQFVIEQGIGSATDDQLIGALYGILDRLPPAIERMRSGSASTDDLILLDACHQVAAALATRSTSIEAKSNLETMASGCAGLRLDVIGGLDIAPDLAMLNPALGYLNSGLRPQ